MNTYRSVEITGDGIIIKREAVSVVSRRNRRPVVDKLYSFVCKGSLTSVWR